MFRKLVLASAVSLALAPGAAAALELGGIRTESALNEPFSGQIDRGGIHIPPPGAKGGGQSAAPQRLGG